MKAILLLLAVALFAPLSAQNAPNVRPPRPRIEAGSPQVANQDPGAQAPDSNISIRLAGTTTTGTGVDLSLSGIGPTFLAEQMMGEDGSVLTCNYSVSKSEKGYRVAYNIGMRIRLATNVTRGEKEVINYEYRDVSLAGVVLCSPGTPVVIVRSATKPLELTLSEDAATPPASGGSR